jgi:hypothetical protein
LRYFASALAPPAAQAAFIAFTKLFIGGISAAIINLSPAMLPQERRFPFDFVTTEQKCDGDGSYRKSRRQKGRQDATSFQHGPLFIQLTEQEYGTV